MTPPESSLFDFLASFGPCELEIPERDLDRRREAELVELFESE